jgi:hypothetical protein
MHSELVPSDFYEQMLHLVNYTQWFIKSDTTLDPTYSMMQWQLTCPSLRVKPLTLNLCFFVLFLFDLFLQVAENEDYKIISMKNFRPSLDLGFLLVISNVIFFSFDHDVKTLYLCGISIKFYFYLLYILFLFLLFN